MTPLTRGCLLALILFAPFAVNAQEVGLPIDPAPAIAQGGKAVKRSSRSVEFTYYQGNTRARIAYKLEVDLLTGQATVRQVNSGPRLLGKTQLTKTEIRHINMALAQAGLTAPAPRPPIPWPRPRPPFGEALGSITKGGIMSPEAAERLRQERERGGAPVPPQLSLPIPDWVVTFDNNGQRQTIRGNDDALGDRSGLAQLADLLENTSQRVIRSSKPKPPIKPWPPWKPSPWPRPPIRPQPLPLPFPPIGRLPRPLPQPILPPFFPRPPLRPLDVITEFAEQLTRYSLPGGIQAWIAAKALQEAVEAGKGGILGTLARKALEEAKQKSAKNIAKGAKALGEAVAKEAKQPAEPGDAKGMTGTLLRVR